MYTVKSIFATILFFLCIIAAQNISAQDIIHLKNKELIKAKVQEIGIDEIKYKLFDNQEGPIMVILKSDVTIIRFENGSEFRINPDPYDTAPEVEIRDRSRAIKFEFFSPLTNDIVFGYEQMIKVGTNLEFKAGIIGPGFGENNENASGVLLKGGIKFLIGSDYVQRGQKFAHQLKGKYIKPELIFNTYTIEKQNWNYLFGQSPQVETYDLRYTNFAVNIVFGKQHILGNAITLDYYIGVGYGIQSNNAPKDSPYDYNYSENYSYSHVVGDSNFPMVYSAGMTLGVLLK